MSKKLTVSAGETRDSLVFGPSHEYGNADVYGVLSDSETDGAALITVYGGGAVERFRICGENLAEDTGDVVLMQGAHGSCITVDDCGELFLKNGAGCEEVSLVNGGRMTVEGERSTADGIQVAGVLTVQKSATVTGVTVVNAGKTTLTGGATGSGFSVVGGLVEVQEALLTGATVTGGGVSLKGTGGETRLVDAVFLGGSLDDGSWVAKENKARIEGLYLGAEATATLLHNVTLAGTVTLAGKMTLKNTTVADNLTLVFDLANRREENLPLLEGYSFLKGKHDVRVALDWNQPRQEMVILDGVEPEPGSGITIVVGDKTTFLFAGEHYETPFLNVKVVSSDDSLGLQVENSSAAVEKTTLSWGAEYASDFVEVASDGGFANAIRLSAADGGVDLVGMQQDGWWRIVDGDGNVRKAAEKVAGSAEGEEASRRYVAGDCNGTPDLLFGVADKAWGTGYTAVHVGAGGWEGTGESVRLNGMTKFTDVFLGGGDDGILRLTERDDALFVDDRFSVSYQGVGGSQTRISGLAEIHAGAGNDLVDLTSRDFAFEGESVVIHGGDGNDTLWGGALQNLLYGDDGDDRLVGGEEDDVLWGGAGNDSLHGGGGDDRFCFGLDWGRDTIEQLEGGSITLCFYDGITAGDLTVGADSVAMGKNTIAVRTAEVNFWFEG